MGLRTKHIALAVAVGVVVAVLAFVIGYFARSTDKDCPKVVRVDREYSKPSALHQKGIDSLSAKNIEDNLRFFTTEPHYGGSKKNSELAKSIADTWRNYGFEVDLKKYKILLSYPESPPLVSVTDGSGNIEFSAEKFEETLEKSEKNKSDVLPPFIAYSKSGLLKDKKLVYVNYGRVEDFEELKKTVDCTGAIVIARYGKIFRGNKVSNAHEAGAVGIILYTDPADYSGGSVDDVDQVASKTFPNTWLMPSTGLQRGNAITVKGDPLTHGLPATEGIYRQKEEDLDFLPQIPAYPMSYKDALEFLK